MMLKSSIFRTRQPLRAAGHVFAFNEAVLTLDPHVSRRLASGGPRRAPSTRRSNAEASYDAFRGVKASAEGPRTQRLARFLSRLKSEGYIDTDLKTSQHIIETLRNYQPGSGDPEPVHKLAKQLSITLEDLSRLGAALIHIPMDGLKSLGLKILMAASEGGDIYTTIKLSKFYLLTSNERSLALALLRKRANEEPPDAMVLTAIGEHYEKNGNIREAVNYYKAAVRLLESDSAKLSDEKESLKSDTPPSRPAPVPHAALPLAELYRKFGRVSEAKQYFEKAALQGDEPNAYWALAEIVYAEQNRYTENWLSYTYKAAVSGHPWAACALGRFHDTPDKELEACADEACQRHRKKLQPRNDWLTRLQGSSTKGDPALEWYRIAWDLGNLDAGVYLADKYLKQGNLTDSKAVADEIKNVSQAQKKQFPAAAEYAKSESKLSSRR